MKTIHETWVLPNTKIELHLVTTEYSIAYFTDGILMVTICKEVRTQVPTDLAHSQFKQGIKESLKEIGTTLNTVMPMLQTQQIVSVEIPISMGLIKAETKIISETLFVSLHISNNDVIAWKQAEHKANDNTIVLNLGDYKAYDQFRNYFDYDFLQLWGELSQ